MRDDSWRVLAAAPQNCGSRFCTMFNSSLGSFFRTSLAVDIHKPIFETQRFRQDCGANERPLSIF